MMFAEVLKYDPAQPRDKSGRWAKVGERIAAFKEKYPEAAKHYPRDTYTEMGSIESHTQDVGREWEKQLSHEELAGISERFGSDVETLMASAIALHDIGKAEAVESGGGKHAQHEHTIPILQGVLHKEGFSEKDVTLATELMNHDLIGPLFRGGAKDTDVAAKLKEKAKTVGMNVADFVTLQLAFYQADASAYPYITQYMDQEPSGKWTFAGRSQIAAVEALTRMARKYAPDQARQPKGSEHGGEFAKTMSGFDPTKKETWYRLGPDWQRSPEGEVPYGWRRQVSPDYEPPTVVHKVIRVPYVGLWGGSHYGSSVITGESAKLMGIDGYKNLGAAKESETIASQMLTAIANDATGSEEPLYHAFQNTRGTVFKPGDTMKLPLMATAGAPHPLYGIRDEHEAQEGPPTVFRFAKGTPMVGYSIVRSKDLEDIGQPTVEAQFKEQGYLWDEAIVAGKFRVTKVETVYMGSQRDSGPKPAGSPVHQIYGQIVHLEPLAKFNPATGKWVVLG